MKAATEVQDDMKQKALAQLLPTSDLDYVEHFQALARLNLEIRGQGATSPRLLSKAILEMDVGNFAAGLEAAKEAAVLDAMSGEAQYQLGVAHVLMAFVSAGAVPIGPGMAGTPRGSVGGLLRAALDCFAEAVRLCPGDQEAEDDLALVRRFLDEHGSDADMAAALRSVS